MTRFWSSMGERFMPPVTIARLPQSLLKRFEASSMIERLAHAPRFIALLGISLISRL